MAQEMKMERLSLQSKYLIITNKYHDSLSVTIYIYT